MTETVLEPREPVVENVGGLDAMLRLPLAFAALLGASLTWATLDVDFGMTTWIHGFILATYLWLTWAARIDPIYALLGVSTARGARGRHRGFDRRSVPMR